MSQQFDAIYENGILRPLLPLALPDQTRVRVVVDTVNLQNSLDQMQETERSDALASQHAALQESFREIDKLPQTKNNDGWSVRNHDDLLYGGNK